MEHLLLLSLGPIQDFIASARRCQDLWFGSWMLSDLARVVAGDVARHGSVVVLPAGLDDEAPGVANVLLAKLRGADPATVVASARESLGARLHLQADAAWASLRDDPQFHEDVARAQLSDLIEVQWVALPLDADFATVRGRLYARLAAIKNTRSWSQPPWDAGPGVPKSSLDGWREAVLDESVYDEHTAEELRRRYGVRGTERLDGVGLLKRRGVEVDEGHAVWGRPGKPPFHSTCHLATVPLLERLDPGPSRAYLDALRDLDLDLSDQVVRTDGGPPVLAPMGDRGFDGGLLLAERLADLLGDGTRSRNRADPRVEGAINALRELLRPVEVSEPSPYYAFLLADGDRMGKAIDGMHTMDDLQTLGTALTEFAGGCQDIVEDHHGTLIFAGGDDVLALLPLHRAVACAVELAASFRNKLGPVVRERWAGEDPAQSPTLSVGLAITHCLAPMSEARALAKRAEALAKVERNSLAILLSKRSGGERSVAGRWSEPTPLPKRLQAWVGLLAAGDLSAAASHDIQALAEHFFGLPVAEQHERRDEAASLFRNVLAHKRRRGGGSPAATGQLLTAWLARASAPPGEALGQLADELLIARELQRAVADAGLDALPLTAPDDSRGDA